VATAELAGLLWQHSAEWAGVEWTGAGRAALG
jgi:hypothetical protein